MDIQIYEKKLNECADRFEELFEMLVSYNKMYNLTAITQKNDVFNKHFLDSIAGESFFKEGARVCEIGSGGGFPSVPLKIIRDDLNFTLIESTGKKCSYLQAVVDKFAFKGVKILNMRAEDGARREELREKFDCAVARAVARMNTLCEYCLPYVKPGGVFVAYKGDCDAELEEAAAAIRILGGRVERVEKFLIAGEKRSIIVIKKISPTPSAYPRGRGLERKRPIGM